jgi:uncharacterized membrane protein YfcA
VLVALLLLLTKVKAALELECDDSRVFGWRQRLIFFGIDAWLGFIVLDGATYLLLLALTLSAGLNLLHANAVKSAVLVPVTLVAIIVFAVHGDIDWVLGAIIGVGSIAGRLLEAKLVFSPKAKRYIFMLLFVVILSELIHLNSHYLFQTHPAGNL